MDGLKKGQSTVISKSSTKNTRKNSREKLMSLQEGFPASLSQQLESKRAQVINAISLIKLSRQFRLYSQNGCFLRMSQESSQATPLLKSSHPLKCVGSSSNLHYVLEVLTVDRFIEEKGSGFMLPTPLTIEHAGSCRKHFRGSTKDPKWRLRRTSDALRILEDDPIYLNPLFGEWMMNLPIGAADTKALEMPKTQW